MTTDPYSFLGRHAVLMAHPDADLPCCFWEAGQYVCQALATHAVVWAWRGGWQVRPRAGLPLLRDAHDVLGEPPRGRQHPEFCAAHAAVVCASTGA